MNASALSILGKYCLQLRGTISRKCDCGRILGPRETDVDYHFVDPIIRGSVLEKWQLQREVTVENPSGGTDLFVDIRDLNAYYDALRSLWEELIPYL